MCADACRRSRHDVATTASLSVRRGRQPPGGIRMSVVLLRQLAQGPARGASSGAKVVKDRVSTSRVVQVAATGRFASVVRKATTGARVAQSLRVMASVRASSRKVIAMGETAAVVATTIRAHAPHMSGWRRVRVQSPRSRKRSQGMIVLIVARSGHAPERRGVTMRAGAVRRSRTGHVPTGRAATAQPRGLQSRVLQASGKRRCGL